MKRFRKKHLPFMVIAMAVLLMAVPVMQVLRSTAASPGVEDAGNMTSQVFGSNVETAVSEATGSSDGGAIDNGADEKRGDGGSLAEEAAQNADGQTEVEERTDGQESLQETQEEEIGAGSIAEEPQEDYEVTPVDPYSMYAQTSLNVREGPGTDYEKLFVLSLNQEVTVVAETDNGWYYVNTQSGQEGYCSAKYLGNEAVLISASSSEGGSVTASVESCLVRKNCTDSQWSEAVRLWKQIPSHWRSQFKTDGWTMYVTTDDFWSQAGYSSAAGYTDLNSQICWIRASGSRMEVTVAHEFAHYIDYVSGWASSSDEFQRCYNNEKDSFSGYMSVGDGHYTSSVMEYFAQVFCQILVAPSTESSAPDSFAYVKKYL